MKAVAQKYEADKLVQSVARFLAGLKPKYGKSYYFEKFRHADVLHKVMELKAKVKGFRCPFCGRTFKRSSSFITHIIMVHYHEVLVYIGTDYLVAPATR